MDETEIKRKEVDIQEASSSSILASSSSPVDLKKRRVGAAASAELIKKNINVLRDFINSDSYEPEKIKAIEALEGILPGDEGPCVDIMFEEGITSLLIEQISETASPSGSDGAREVLEERAVSLLRDLVTVEAEVGRVMIEGGAIPRLFRLLRREHRHADDEVPLRLKRVVFQTLELISRYWAKDLLRRLLVQRDYDDGVDIVRGLMSPDRRVQVFACNIFGSLAASSVGQQVFVSADCATQLAVMLSSKVDLVRSAAAGTIMSLCFSEQDDFEYTVKTFIRNGVLQQIVHMLHDSNEECRSLATRLLTRFLGRRVALTTTFTLAGAVRPLILMLDRPRLLKEATFALNHLSISVQAEAVNYQILLEGGLAALMTAFRLPDVQRDRELVLVLAALLFRVATYRDGFVFFVKMGGLRMLRTTEMHEEDVRDMASTYLGHMEILMMGEADEYNAKSLVLAAREADAGDELGSLCVHGLAVLANPTKFGAIFVYHNLLEILLDLYGRFFNEAQQQEGAEALYSIACRSREFLQRHVLANNLDVREIVDEALNYQSHTAQPDPHPTTEVGGLDFDVTFLLDNNTKPILAHKRVLRKVSRVFEVLLEDDYFQSTGGVIPVHNIGFSAFKSVMQFIYTGRLREDTTLHEYCDIFIAADFYDVISLKRVCELFIARHHVAQETVADVYEFGERYDSKLLIHVCILFLLEHHQQVRSLSGYRTLVEKIIPEMRRWFPTFIPGPQHGFIAPLSGL